MAERLTGKRALVTSVDRYMGAPIADLFEAEGAVVVRDNADLRSPKAVDSLLDKGGAIDILVANLAEAEQRWEFVPDITDEVWTGLFDELVHPMMRLVRGAVPGMKERGGGKIVAVTSAAPLRGIPKGSAYCAARGAQNAFVRAAGLELARHNIQFNAIAQNYVENVTYYDDEMLGDEKLMERMLKVIPSKRLGKGHETAELALFLASNNSDFIVGQVIPFAGGWATNT